MGTADSCFLENRATQKLSKNHLFIFVIFWVIEMSSSFRLTTKTLPTVQKAFGLRMMSGDGSGVGHGGGGGGSIREAGGSFGKMEAAREEQYFRQKQAEQLAKMKDHHEEEIETHRKHIEMHKEAIKRHEQKMKNLEAEHKDCH